MSQFETRKFQIPGKIFKSELLNLSQPKPLFMNRNLYQMDISHFIYFTFIFFFLFLLLNIILTLFLLIYIFSLSLIIIFPTLAFFNLLLYQIMILTLSIYFFPHSFLKSHLYLSN
jgi:hypothetical protein